MTAADLVVLLELKHAKDVFVRECKTGPTQGATHLRLDAWAMARSWARPSTWGYEIKCTRSDFLQDEKWRSYLDYCSQFYFVVPNEGVASVAEVGNEAGLLVASKNCKRLFVRKKAPNRDVTIPEDLWRYVLMCRSRVVMDTSTVDGSAAYWRNWLDSRESDKDLGHRVSRRIAVEHRKLLSEHRRMAERMSKAEKMVERIERLSAELGVSDWTSDRVLREKLAERLNGVQPGALHAIEVAVTALREVGAALGGPEVKA